jgi:hypothetical protein
MAQMKESRGSYDYNIALLGTDCSAASCISNNSSFHQKHPGVPVGSDGSDGTSYSLTEK